MSVLEESLILLVELSNDIFLLKFLGVKPLPYHSIAKFGMDNIDINTV